MNAAHSCCLVLLFAATSLWAQKTASPPETLLQSAAASPAAMTFTVEVTDKAGHPVTGLQQSDFSLLDNKSPLSIQAFAAHAPSPQDPESTIILFDNVNMGFGGDSIARDQIMNLLQKPGNHIVFPVSLLMITDTGLRQLGTASSDPQELLATLKKEGGELRDIGRSAGFWGAAEREENAVNALNTLVRAAGEMPGRKQVIWLGPGWPIFDNPTITYTDTELHDVFDEVVLLSNEMTKAQVTLYDVDPLGSRDAGSFRTFAWESFTKPVREWSKALPADLALQVIATHSGGLVLNGSNDVAGEVNRCAEDGAGWYTITFMPQSSEKPDIWHSVDVRLDKPGLIARTRPGYYAQP